MKIKIITSKQIAACPTAVLSPSHYRKDGTCLHQPESGWKDRDWVMIPRSFIRYPSKQVYDKQPSKRHPLGVWHFEDDTTQEPKVTRITPTFLTRNQDGTYTTWTYTIYGPVGHTGILTPANLSLVQEIKLSRDRKDLAKHISVLESADHKGKIIAETMLSVKHGKEVKL